MTPRHPTKSLTKAQQKKQQLLLEAMRRMVEQEKVDGLTVEERWERHLASDRAESAPGKPDAL